MTSGMTSTLSTPYSLDMARRALDTLLDPATVVDMTRLDVIRSIVSRCQDMTLTLPVGSGYEAMILDRCAAVIARYRLYR